MFSLASARVLWKSRTMWTFSSNARQLFLWWVNSGPIVLNELSSQYYNSEMYGHQMTPVYSLGGTNGIQILLFVKLVHILSILGHIWPNRQQSQIEKHLNWKAIFKDKSIRWYSLFSLFLQQRLTCMRVRVCVCVGWDAVIPGKRFSPRQNWKYKCLLDRMVSIRTRSWRI